MTAPSSPVWRGYRWPLHEPRAQAEVVNAPAWHWLIVGLLLSVGAGLFDFNAVIEAEAGPVKVYGNDMVFVAGAALALLQFNGGDRRPLITRGGTRTVLVALALFAVLAVMMIIRDFRETLGDFGNLQTLARVWPYFALFFAVAAFVATPGDLKMLLRVWFIITAAGTAIIILQSLRGDVLLFGDNFISRMLVPPGPQIIVKYGIFHRSNFPIYFSAIWWFFFLSAMIARRPSLPAIAAAAFFSMAFILNMARGAYFGVALAAVVFLVLMAGARQMSLRLAVVSSALIGSLLFLIPVLGLGGLDEIIVGRTTSGLQDYRLREGTWQGRLVQAERYWEQEPEGMDLLFGYGYTGSRSELNTLFLEFGPVDLLYRSGVVGTVLLSVVLLLLGHAAIAGVIRWRAPVHVAIAMATLCSLISQTGEMPSANHFYYPYYAAVIGGMSALLAAAAALERLTVRPASTAADDPPRRA